MGIKNIKYRIPVYKKNSGIEVIIVNRNEITRTLLEYKAVVEAHGGEHYMFGVDKNGKRVLLLLNMI